MRAADVITPYREESEGDRKGRPPQNYRIEHPLKPKRPCGEACSAGPSAIITQASAITSTCRRISCALMSARRYGGAISSSLSTATHGTGRSPGTSTRPRARGRPSFERFMASRRRAYVDNHEIYMEGGELAVDFLGRYETSMPISPKRLHDRRRAQARRPEVQRRAQQEDAAGLSELLHAKTEALVREWYAPEIELLKYGFYGPDGATFLRAMVTHSHHHHAKGSRSRSETSSSG